MQRFNILLVFGAIIVSVVLLAALIAPWLAPYPEDYRDNQAILAPPSAAHILGTDENGSDLLSQVIFGARVAVVVGFSTVLICLTIGIVVGSISGYASGWVDEVVMRFTEVVLSFPGILLAIFIIFLTQRPSLLSVILALSATGWAGYARLVRGQMLQVREAEYVTAVRSLGASPLRIVLWHCLPNIMAPVIVQATFGIAGAILAEASLSFLGLGPQSNTSWGAMLDQGAVLFIKSPYLAVIPGSAIFLTVLGINFIGDYLRDRYDPRRA